MFVKNEKCKCFKLLFCDKRFDALIKTVETTLQLAINLFHENNIFVCFSSNNE